MLWFLSNDGLNDLADALTIFNTITFDGNGNYSVNGATVYDAASGPISNLTVNGTYTIAASGYGFMDNPASQLIGEEYGITLSTPDQIYGSWFRTAFSWAPAPRKMRISTRTCSSPRR